jgi:hypothetical protein
MIVVDKLLSIVVERDKFSFSINGFSAFSKCTDFLSFFLKQQKYHHIFL